MRDTIAGAWEQAYPYLLGLVAGGLVTYLPSDIGVQLDSRGLTLSAFYAALFNINIFGAGVMISVFVFTQAPAAGFIALLEKLAVFLRFRRYLKEAIITGLLAGIFCVPLSAATTKALSLPIMAALEVAVVALSVCFVALCFRASQIFLFWSSRN